MEIPPPIARRQPVNYVQINNSTVGVLNTGTIHNLQVAMNDLLAAGQQDVAEALRAVSEAALNDSKADPTVRNDVAEQIESLAEQAAALPAQRKVAVVKATIARIGQLVSVLSTAKKAWELAHPIIQAHFGVT
jgi:hypothetical protein